MSVIDTLVTDRSLADVQLWQQLKALGWGAMTQEQQTLWSSGVMKGAYNASDLNRVIEAVNYLAGVFQSYGYDIPGFVQQSASWITGQVPTQSQMQAYLGNIQAMNTILTSLPSTPELPQSIALLSYAAANSIEQVLIDLDGTLQRLAQCLVACGPATCGGDYF